MGKITELSHGSLNGLRRQTNECLKNAYNKGFEDGNKITDKDMKEIQDSTYDVAYSQGIKDFENLLVYEHDYEQFFEDTYGSKDPDYNLYDLVAKYGAKKVLDDFKKWQEQKKQAEEEIKVGDEVCRKDRNDCKVVITGFIKEDMANAINFQGSSYIVKLTEYERTGRHFDEIEQVLDKLKGDK